MKIAAVIPAYNEENTIQNVIEAIKTCDMIDDIIVVSDGSTDRTALTARECGVTVLELQENIGKGGAMRAGADICSAQILLFLDADLIGLTKEHIQSLIEPVYEDIADMTVGVFAGGRMTTDLAQKILPYLSGQRAVRREMFNKVDNLEESGFGVELALTLYAQRENLRVLEIELDELTHVMKEEKLGIIRGTRARAKMYWEIIKGLSLARH